MLLWQSYDTSFFCASADVAVHPYLRVIQESVDGVDVGVGSHHHSVGGDSGQVTLPVLRHLAPAAMSTQQLEVWRLEVLSPLLTGVTWSERQSHFETGCTEFPTDDYVDVSRLSNSPSVFSNTVTCLMNATSPLFSARHLSDRRELMTLLLDTTGGKFNYTVGRNFNLG